MDRFRIFDDRDLVSFVTSSAMEMSSIIHYVTSLVSMMSSFLVSLTSLFGMTYIAGQSA